MAKKKREMEAFSLSFLDVITCGFGAIILLLVIVKNQEAVVPEPQPQEDTEALELQLAQLENKQLELQAELDKKLAKLKSLQSQQQQIKALLASNKKSIHEGATKQAVNEAVKDQLESALQSLTEEMKRLLAARSTPKNDVVGGIPVDSEYIIFIIDTSGSMFNHSWGKMIKTMRETLEVYPKVKGIQIMNDMGQYMFSQYKGRWIPDTPTRRKVILRQIRNWNPFSNSSPVEGIVTAIRDFYSPDKKISLYVLGDEFSGASISSVVRKVDRINPKDKYGNPRVRIHAVGFPVQFLPQSSNNSTGVRFAMLMRELTRKNGGTFVALNTTR